jgi:hypothetical protein
MRLNRTANFLLAKPKVRRQRAIQLTLSDPVEETIVSRSQWSTPWNGSAVNTESTLHQLSPYIGKMKSSMAARLIDEFTKRGQKVYDPFAGCGTIALEAWIARRRVIANDISLYGSMLTRAKLSPYLSLDSAFRDIEQVAEKAVAATSQVDLRTVEPWVRQFFNPETLREILGWTKILEEERLDFLRSCLMGILHHQRPGFLSYPSSHTIPYLRLKKFPRERFPDLYQYRPVRERLEAKVARALRRLPALDCAISRRCFTRDSSRFVPPEHFDAIITSPPYMWQLDYGRDNRLRLWFLGIRDWRELDKRASLSEKLFMVLMRRCLRLWRRLLPSKGPVVLVLGDTYCAGARKQLPDVIEAMAVDEIGGYSRVARYDDVIPNIRRVRRRCRGSTSETVLVLKTH